MRDIGFKEKGYSISSKSNYDLAITKNGKIFTLLETKKIHSSEMITEQSINKKSFQEAILYFMNEFITNHNTALTYSIVTDGVDWFIFDAKNLKKLFADDKAFKQQYNESQVTKSNLNETTNDFYINVASPQIEKVSDQIEYTHLNLQHVFYKNGKIHLNNANKAFKVLSPNTLLKQNYIADPNELDKNFYDELMYIMGLQEKKDSKGIERASKNSRNKGSLVELVYSAFDTLDFNFQNEEKKFDYAINIVTTWTNRILFLKLLESQLVNFNNGDTSYKFMSSKFITDFNKLNELFFGVLAKPENSRGNLTEKYKKIPYLNSSLFERSNVEMTLKLSPAMLDDNILLRINNKSILKNKLAKGSTKLPTLDYLLLFLNSYNFDTEAKNIKGEHLINASVLGLIFEKINGYKDGSYYTPGFVTSFMAKKAIDQALVNKFQAINWQVENIDDINKHIYDQASKNQALSILKQLKIVDPAVGSGHFLVSALNYLVYLHYKFDLVSNEFRRNYIMRISNDELEIVDNEGIAFSYSKNNEKSNAIQKELFLIKLDIIEHNLFGVDINQNSVNITRLRLWIELLKHAFYENGYLKTMPNLEMNIKIGNSVVSRFSLDESLSNLTQGMKMSVSDFKDIVQKYRNTDDKNLKHNLAKTINNFKKTVRANILNSKGKKLKKKYQSLNELKSGVPLFKNNENQQIKDLQEEINDLESLINNENPVLFASSFEWRFEFPEVLKNNAKFQGFDVVIANPPYIGMQGHSEIFNEVKSTELGKRFSEGKMDFFYYFIHLAINILNNNGVLCFITTNYWPTATYAGKLRRHLLDQTTLLHFYNFNELTIFSSAKGQHNMITLANKGKKKSQILVTSTSEKGMADYRVFHDIVSKKNQNTQYRKITSQNKLSDSDTGYFILNENNQIISKLSTYQRLHTIIEGPSQGITTGANDLFLWTKEEVQNAHLTKYEKDTFKPLIYGSSLTEQLISKDPDCYVMYTSSNDTDLNRIPNLKSHIKNFNDYEHLHKRAMQDKKNGDQFYLWRARSTKIFNKNAIYFQKRTSDPVFSLNINHYFIKDDSYSITLRGKYNSQKNVLFLLCVLNSIFTKFWLVAKGRKKGKSLELYPEIMKSIPIPNINKITNEDIEEIQKALTSMDIQNFKKYCDHLVAKWFEFPDNQIEKIQRYIEATQ